MFGLLQFQNINIDKLFKSIELKNTSKLWRNTKVIFAKTLNKSSYNTLIYESNDNVVLFKGRLDNRKDFFKHFNIKDIETCNAKLISLAYTKWGEKCTDYLLGDWAFAAWDKKNKKLSILRDHSGISSIYYYLDSNFLIFSSDINEIITSDLIKVQPNVTNIKKIILGIYDHGNTTFYENIYSLLPSHLLTIKDFNSLNIKKYWDLKNIPKINYKNKSDYYSHFKELLREAIDSRLDNDSKTGSFLSGGLDSTSITSIAADLLKKENKTLHTYTSIPQYEYKKYIGKNRIGNETDNVNLLVNKYPNIIPHFTDSKDKGPIEAVKKMLKIHNHPGSTLANNYWITNIMDIAKSLDISTMLIGQSGNQTISWPPILDSKKISSNLFTNSKLLCKTLFTKHETNLNFHQSILNHNSFSDNELKNSLVKKRELHKNRTLKSKISNDYRIKLIEISMTKSRALLNQLGNYYGIQIKDPSNDKRILDFCLSIPEEIFSKNNKYRLLIRESMKDNLPESILRNNCRGIQSADLPERMMTNKESIINELEQLEHNNLAKEIINVNKMQDIAKKLLSETFVNEAQRHSRILLLGIAISNFLRQFD